MYIAYLDPNSTNAVEAEDAIPLSRRFLNAKFFGDSTWMHDERVTDWVVNMATNCIMVIEGKDFPAQDDQPPHNPPFNLTRDRHADVAQMMAPSLKSSKGKGKKCSNEPKRSKADGDGKAEGSVSGKGDSFKGSSKSVSGVGCEASSGPMKSDSPAETKHIQIGSLLQEGSAKGS